MRTDQLSIFGTQFIIFITTLENFPFLFSLNLKEDVFLVGKGVLGLLVEIGKGCMPLYI